MPFRYRENSTYADADTFSIGRPEELESIPTPTQDNILSRYLNDADHAYNTDELLREISKVLLKMRSQGRQLIPKAEVGFLNLEFFWRKLDELQVLKGPKCLEWTDVLYMNTSRFRTACTEMYEFAHVDAGYCGQVGTHGTFKGKYGVGFCGDIYNATGIIPVNYLNTIICTQVFEHLEEPELGAKQLYEVLAPEGLLIWTAPMTSMSHVARGIGHFFGYTLQGAVYTLSKAGFCVFFATGGNDPFLTAMSLLGRPNEEIVSNLGGADALFDSLDSFDLGLFPLNVMVLATKTEDCDSWRSKGNFNGGSPEYGRWEPDVQT